MKKAFLFAYLSKNLGDDLFVKSICDRYPDTEFELWGRPDELSYAEQFGKIRIIDSENKLLQNIKKKILPSATARYRDYLEKKCRAVVYIGGSILIEYENWRDISNWWEYEAKKDKFYVIGANFGPYQSEDYRKRMSDIFLKMKDVCFRDQYSKNQFPDHPVVRYAPDILFSYPIPQIDMKKKQAFFSVIDCASKDEGSIQLKKYADVYINQISSLVNELINKGWSIVLSSFCKHEGDEEAIDKIIKNISDLSKVQTINYNGSNYNEVLKTLAESEYVFASRFHATIFALSAGRPVIPVLYSNKTLNVLHDMGFEGKYVDIRKMDQNQLLSAYQLIRHPEKQMIENIEYYKKASLKHFEKLDQVLKK